MRNADGHDYLKTNKYVLFGHHFAAIAAAGPLLGPVLAAQFGFLPGALSFAERTARGAKNSMADFVHEIGHFTFGERIGAACFSAPTCTLIRSDYTAGIRSVEPGKARHRIMMLTLKVND